MSVIHLHADTYPYKPGTTVRTGKPCATGGGWPFIAIASSASRWLSIAVATGVPEGKPSKEVQNNWVPPDLMPASCSSARRLAPSHFALPTYGPPTGFETQVSVM